MMNRQDNLTFGANSQMKFGVSSAGLGEGEGIEGAGGGERELPFLKKWVRTRHAILFRLSNRTVQVLFFDRSEILLSYGERIVTYVNKQGERSEYPLDEILPSGRVDISKRLKYTKDIMFRLINFQQPTATSTNPNSQPNQDQIQF